MKSLPYSRHFFHLYFLHQGEVLRNEYGVPNSISHPVSTSRAFEAAVCRPMSISQEKSDENRH